AALVIVAASAAIRWPGFTQGGLASHDVGGILYNAMLLRSGGLPYVDSVEWKAPGSFYVAALVADGNDIAALQVAANLVALGSLVLVMALAWRLWGRGAAVACGAVFALHDAQLDSMDANYVTWALLPQIAALALAFAARRRPVPSVMWLASGALCGVATLCKQPAGIVIVPVIACALRSAGKWELRAGATVVLGFVAAHAPIGLHYLARGQLGALLASYVGADWGMAYIGHHADMPLHLAAWEGLAATVFFLALPLTLAVFATAARPRDETASATTRLLWIWALAAIAGAAVGLRFYKGYFLAALPPLCLLAAAPWGMLAAGFWRRGVARWLAAPVLALLVARAGVMLHATRVDRARPHDDGARKLADHIARHSEPGARIWVWGWHLWGVYAYSDRLSASPIYKTPGLLTRFDDDTWRRPSTPVTLIPDSPHADRLLRDLDAARPIFITLGGSVPREKFVALRRFLLTHYERDRRITVGKVEVWRRRD
ncbi:MAG TPA: hypothetical protein VGB85_17775, partial [Nannocystis sp.]